LILHILAVTKAGNRPVIEPRNRVVEVTCFGSPDGLRVVDAPLPTAGRGEVRVRVLASGLEYTDTLIRRRVDISAGAACGR